MWRQRRDLLTFTCGEAVARWEAGKGLFAGGGPSAVFLADTAFNLQQMKAIAACLNKTACRTAVLATTRKQALWRTYGLSRPVERFLPESRLQVNYGNTKVACYVFFLGAAPADEAEAEVEDEDEGGGGQSNGGSVTDDNGGTGESDSGSDAKAEAGGSGVTGRPFVAVDVDMADYPYLGTEWRNAEWPGRSLPTRGD
jgi:hypothetical protein